jgi:DNA-binding transcriptional MocR family regulator
MFSFEEFTDALYEAGWRADCDAQHTEVVAVYDEMVSESRKAQRIAELRQQVATLTEQRDLAGEALKTAKHGLVQWHVPENRYAALDAVNGVLAAIKSSEVKK